jgi:HK97 family phage major capsid protein
MSLAELERDLDLPRPRGGNWRSALYRPDAPGAVLDGQPWAKSWAAFLRAVNDPHDAAARTFIANAMTERIPAEGGFLVPEFLRSQVLDYMTDAIIRPKATVVAMNSERLPIPLLDNASQASNNQALGGMTFSFVQEGAAFTGTTPAFGRIVLQAWKAGSYLANVPNELVDDAAGAFGDFLARVIARGYAWFEDDVFIGGLASGTGGTGTGEPQSLANAPCAVAVSRHTASDVLFVDIVAMYKALHPASKQIATMPGMAAPVWLISASAFDQILELYYNPSGSEVVPPSGWFSAGDGDTVGASLIGVPAIVTDHQPAVGDVGDVILADLRYYLIGDRLTMTVDRSQQSNFIDDVSNFRVKSRVDGRYWIQSATTTEAAQSVSPVVVLH